MLAAGIGEPYDSATGKGVVGKNYCYQVSGNTDDLLRGQGDQSVHGRRRARRRSTISRATISIMAGSASSAAP